jgi:type IV secretion system protein VirB8
MDKTFKKDEETRRQHLVESRKLRQERNRALFGHVLYATAILGLTAAVVVLSNIHTVIPVVTVIDAKGNVLKQRVVDKDNVAAEEALIESDLYSFVNACNTFDPRTRQALSDTCHLFSSPEVAKQYEKEISPDNPDNPYAHLSEKSWISAQAYGINKIGETYQVSFTSEYHETPTSEPVKTNFVATVKVAHTLVPRQLGDRWVNPLGFIATTYRKNEELIRR